MIYNKENLNRRKELRMKKLLAIIAVLLVILIGMIIYRNGQKQVKNISVEEVSSIEQYLQKIYLWKEITNQAIPLFETIEEADDTWIWEVVKKNLEEYEVDKIQLEEKAKDLFGQEFVKEYPEEGTKSFVYDEETKKYYPTESQLDEQEDLFLLDTIQRTEEGYEVEIVEYLEDYTKAEEGQVEIKNINDEMIASVDSNQVDVKGIDLVKENKDRFTKKRIFLKVDGDKIFVTKVEEVKE